MTNIQIVNDQRTYNVGDYDPEDRWDRPDTSTENYIRGFRVVGENDFSDLSVGFDVDESRPYYLLYAVYSTGDSFGHDEGRIEFVGLYESLDVARENEARINRHNDLNDKLSRYYRPSSKEEEAELKKIEKTYEPYSVELVTEDGQEYKVHVPWTGYFERLTYVEVEPVLAR